MSLIEILVVISICAVLASLLLPAVQSARQAASRTHCQNNLRQIGLALTAHAVTHGRLPGGGATSVVAGVPTPRARPRAFDGQPARLEHQTWGWAYQILPFLEQENRWLNPDELVVRRSHVSVYLCTSQERDSFEFADEVLGAFDYVGNGCSDCDLTANGADNGDGNGNGGMPPGQGLNWGTGPGPQDGVFVQTLAGNSLFDVRVLQKSRALESIRDGLSNTVFVAEKRYLATSTPCNETTGWVSGYPSRQDDTVYGHDTLFTGLEGSPAENERDASVQCTSRAGGSHGSGGNVLFGDGSVRFLAFDLDPDLWRALLSVNGKEDLDLTAGEVLSP